QVPVEDMANPGGGGALEDPGGADAIAEQPPGFDSNPRSIWPAIYPELLELVQKHTSTLIFVNNRRAAERIAKRLNELANDQPAVELPATEQAGNGASSGGLGTHAVTNSTVGGGAPVEIARAHHGSLAHEERLVVEELLKS